VGSARNLSRRLSIYYSLLSIQKILNRSKSRILGALLKYGYSKFTLEILEYCDFKDLIKREQYYINLLKPEYNIMKIAGSRLGSGHTEETRAKMSILRTGKKHSEETKAKMSSARSKEKNPMFRIPRPEGAGKPNQSVLIIDLEKNIETKYDSIKEAALAIGINPAIISVYFRNNQQKPYKKRYIFKRCSSS